MSTFEQTWRNAPPQKTKRLRKLSECMAALPPARTGLEAYAQISSTLNLLEDQIWGPDHWAMPRSYEGGITTDRLYPSHPESFETVAGYAGVTNMVHTKEFIFISRTGAIEIQFDTGESESDVHFCTRRHAVVFSKCDSRGNGVWHESNKDNAARDERTVAGSIIIGVRAVVGTSGWIGG